MNLGTVKSRRDERVGGVGDNFVFLRLCECGERANAQQRQNNTGHGYKQPNQNAQIKENGLSSALVHSGEEISFTRSASKMSRLFASPSDETGAQPPLAGASFAAESNVEVM